MINTWKKFGKIVRVKGCCLLEKLKDFPNAILVSGCQRSGTTILTRVINKSNEVVDYWEGKDDELDAALILSGAKTPKSMGRYCFQTTYLNECYTEYSKYKDQGFKLIWVLRDPYAVVYSMVHNWSRFALNELYNGCGKNLMKHKELTEKPKRIQYVSQFKKACFSYNSKVLQYHELLNELGSSMIKLVHYDELVNNSESCVKEIFQFIDLTFKPSYVSDIHSNSLKKKKKLRSKEERIIEELCVPVYDETLKFIDRK